jgi:hypothetical protein
MVWILDPHGRDGRIRKDAIHLAIIARCSIAGEHAARLQRSGRIADMVFAQQGAWGSKNYLT